MMLKINNVTKNFGGLWALKNVSININEKEIFGLMGPNGSGKTTLLNVINGVYKLDGGTISFENERIDELKPYEIARKGIGRTFQTPKLFSAMTVLENMLVPAVNVLRSNEELSTESKKAKSIELLKFVGLVNLTDELARNLSGGQQKLLEFGRALMLDPNLMLLDEPTAGVHPLLREKIIKLVQEMRDKGKAFLIVSHDVALTTRICERVAVLSAGEKIAEGTPNEIRNNDMVVEAYLGE